MAQKKVLIVDDDPYISEMYSIKFKEGGFDVSVASNGKEALEKAKENPDLMLLDIVMPVYDGFEVLKRLKADDATKDLKVVVLSNLGQREDVERGKELGALDYVIKAHFTPSEVLTKVKSILG